MRAPKTPVSTGTPSSRSAAQKLLDQRLRLLRCGRSREARSVPLARVRDQRELADDERRPAGIEQRAVQAALVVLEDAQPRHFAGQAHRVVLAVLLGDSE